MYKWHNENAINAWLFVWSTDCQCDLYKSVSCGSPQYWHDWFSRALAKTNVLICDDHIIVCIIYICIIKCHFIRISWISSMQTRTHSERVEFNKLFKCIYFVDCWKNWRSELSSDWVKCMRVKWHLLRKSSKSSSSSSLLFAKLLLVKRFSPFFLVFFFVFAHHAVE